MKRIVIIAVLLISVLRLNAQNRIPKTMIDLYFTSYSHQPEYEVNTMGEDMIKNTLKIGMWTNPAFARIMRQIKTYQYVDFRSTAELNKKIINHITEENHTNHIYKEYFRWEMNGKVSSIIYTKGSDNDITEVVYLTIDSKDNVDVSCFVGDHISMESIEDLAKNK
jgi:hypothetical protein